MKLKNTLEGINSWLNDTEECVSDLQGRIVEITHSETFAKRKAHFKNMKTVQDIFGITSSIPTFTL